jgi:tRNA threonylcarbamoyladenosine modification (KEOPS) complex Cgi121 subunit
MMFRTGSDEKGSRLYHIGICGMTGCTVENGVNQLFDRLKTFDKDQTILAVQLFDSGTIATHLHPLISALYALHAFKTSKNISNTLGTEILLYASAQRQIIDAIQRIGLKPTSRNVAAIAVGSKQERVIQIIKRVTQELGGQMDDNVLSINEPEKVETIERVFGISRKELESIQTRTDAKDLEWSITRRVLSRISIMAISK